MKFITTVPVIRAKIASDPGPSLVNQNRLATGFCARMVVPQFSLLLLYVCVPHGSVQMIKTSPRGYEPTGLDSATWTFLFDFGFVSFSTPLLGRAVVALGSSVLEQWRESMF